MPFRDTSRRRLGLEALESRTLLTAGLAGIASVSPLAPSIQVDYDTVSLASVPNDPRLGDQWSFNNTGQNGGKPGADIGALAAWQVTTGSTRTVVSVMDTGVDYTHEDLYLNIWINQKEIPAAIRSRLVDVTGDGLITFRDLNDPRNQGWGKALDLNGNGYIDADDLLRPISQGGWATGTDTAGNGFIDDIVGWNFVENNNRPMDTHGHGTHIAGTIGATGNNNLGVSGVNWAVQIMPIRFVDGTGGGSISAYIAGLNYAVQNGARISNNSWTGATASSLLTEAVDQARARGHIIVAAAGNSSTNIDQSPLYPAAFSSNNVVAVASTDRHDRLSEFSNFGSRTVNIAAPGEGILSTRMGGGYATNSGTSMATPHVTGALALVWARNPNWSYTQVINQVLSTADRLPSLTGKVATGRLNVGAALGAPTVSSTAPRVTQAISHGGTASSMRQIRVTFDRTMNPATFTTASVTLTGPDGRPIAVSWTAPVANSGNTTFDIGFVNQTAAGNYTLRINGVRDSANIIMSAYSRTFSLTSGVSTPPQVLSAVNFGNSTTSMQQIRVTFDRAMDPATLSTQSVSLTGPDGRAIPISWASPISGTDNRTFGIGFDLQTAGGNYTLRLTNAIRDTAGVALSSFARTFTLTPPAVVTLPTVVSADSFGGSATLLKQIRVTFDRAMNASTFNASAISITGPGGRVIPVSWTAAVSGSNGRTFDIGFASQTQAGTYTLRLTNAIRDTAGGTLSTFTRNYTLSAPVTVAPLNVVSADSFGGSATLLKQIRVTFDRAINPATFNASAISITGPGGRVIPVSWTAAVSGSNGRTFDIGFASQTQAGTYTLRLTNAIRDTAGVALNTFTRNYTLSAPVTVAPLNVVSADSFGGSATLLKQIRVTFDRAINPATFNASAISITGPGGRVIPVSWTAAVSGSNGRTFDIGFASQTQAGTYTLRLTNAIRDTAGVALNTFTRNYTLSAPVTVAPLNVVSADSFGGSATLLKQIRVTFDRAINPATFNASAISITGPGGRVIPVSWTAAVSGSNGRTFDIGFASQTQAGTYTLRLTNAIRDTAGVALNTFTRNYTLTQGTPALATVNYSNHTNATVTPQGRAVSMINVPNNMILTDVNVTVNITHPRTSDLYIHLQAPDGTNIVLFNRKGGNSANLVRTTFDDQASNHIAYAQGPFTGSYIPDVLLSALNGKNASGSWKLWVVDRAGVNVGTLTSWSLQLTGRPA